MRVGSQKSQMYIKNSDSAFLLGSTNVSQLLRLKRKGEEREALELEQRNTANIQD